MLFNLPVLSLLAAIAASASAAPPGTDSSLMSRDMMVARGEFMQSASSSSSAKSTSTQSAQKAESSSQSSSASAQKNNQNNQNNNSNNDGSSSLSKDNAVNIQLDDYNIRVTVTDANNRGTGNGNKNNQQNSQSNQSNNDDDGGIEVKVKITPIGNGSNNGSNNNSNNNNGSNGNNGQSSNKDSNYYQGSSSSSNPTTIVDHRTMYALLATFGCLYYACGSANHIHPHGRRIRNPSGIEIEGEIKEKLLKRGRGRLTTGHTAPTALSAKRSRSDIVQEEQEQIGSIHPSPELNETDLLDVEKPTKIGREARHGDGKPRRSKTGAYFRVKGIRTGMGWARNQDVHNLICHVESRKQLTKILDRRRRQGGRAFFLRREQAAFLSYGVAAGGNSRALERGRGLQWSGKTQSRPGGVTEGKGDAAR
ncbi:hypothetical protein K438DRAFT_2088045 [Mycena galopus ATCC 62051]|nr:hypothetical protein K438DRAFT_2088045 [Mycena galopus ATCC 62051]